MENVTITLVRAVVNGALPAVRQFFTIPSMAEAVAQTNAAHRRQREEALARNESPFESDFSTETWYNYHARKYSHWALLESIVMQRKHRILKWFLSSEACQFIEDTMRGLVSRIVTCAIYLLHENSLEVLDVALNSHVFVEVLSPIERYHSLHDKLMAACSTKCAGLIRYLIAHGADGNGVASRESLMEICGVSGSVECIEQLVASGVFGVQHSTASWVRPFKSVDVTLALINYGVDLLGQLNHNSSLHVNTFYRHNRVVETLVRDGYVDVDVRGENGVTPLMVAARRQTMQRSGLDIASLLVAQGANVRKKN